MCVFFCYFVCVCESTTLLCLHPRVGDLICVCVCVCVCFCNFAAIVSIVLAVFFCSGLFTDILGNKFAYLNVENKTLINLFFETNAFACLIFFSHSDSFVTFCVRLSDLNLFLLLL